MSRPDRTRVTAAVLRDVGRLELDTVLIDAPGPFEVRVRPAFVGLCHGDLHYVDGIHRTDLPEVLGHEAAGIVEAVGDQVTAVSAGDRVITSLTMFCGTCRYCVTGRLQLCRNRAALRHRARPALLDEAVDAASDAVDAVRQHSRGGVDFSFEAVGRQATAEAAFAMLAPGGVCTVLGMVPDDTPIRNPASALYFEERRLQGAFIGSSRFPVDVPQLAAFAVSGRLRLQEIITDRLPLADIGKGFDAMRVPAAVCARSSRCRHHDADPMIRRRRSRPRPEPRSTATACCAT